MMTDNQLEYYTIKGIAQMFGVSERTIRRLIKDGSIPAFKVGDQWRVSQEQLNQYIESTANGNQSQKLV